MRKREKKGRRNGKKEMREGKFEERGGGGYYEHACVVGKSVLLSAFAKMRETTISFGMSVCPSIRPSLWDNSAPIGRNFMEFHI
jgi:hypothetical protein